MRNQSLLIIVILGAGIILWSCGQTTTETTPPSPASEAALQAPKNLSISKSNRQILLSWSSSENTASYEVYVTTTSGSSYELIATTTATELTIVWSISGIPSYYAVKAVSGTMESSYSTEVSTTEPNIKGPATGEGGNQQDEVFKSLIVSSSNPNLVYVGSEGNGIFKSTDGGTNWAWIRDGLRYWNDPTIGGTSSYPEIYEVVIDPNDNNIVYAATIPTYGPVTGNYISAVGGVYKTTNAGTSWAQRNNGLNNAGLGCIAIDPSNSSTLYIGAKGGYSNPTGTNQFYPGGIFKSTDSGATWTGLTLPTLSDKSQFWKIKLLDSNTIYAIGINWETPSQEVGIIKSSNAGSSWTRISPSDKHFTQFDVSPANSNLIYALDWSTGMAVFYKTTDGGSSWNIVTAEVIPSGPFKFSPDGNSIFFPTSTSSKARLYKTADGFQTTSAVLTIEATNPPSDYIEDIEFTSDSDIIYVGTMGLCIYKSTDAGNTFTLIKNLREFINSN